MSDTTHHRSPRQHDLAGQDPRPHLHSSLSLAGLTIAAVKPEQAGGPTPCPEYPVRVLVSHMVSVARRISVVLREGDPFSVPNLAENLHDADWSSAWEAAAREVISDLADPSVLGKTVRMPFGTMPGGAAIAVYTSEITLHTWDLAKATDQRPAWQPDVLASAIASMQRVPASPRGGPVPFGPVIEVPDDAAPIDRLVAWSGRRP